MIDLIKSIGREDVYNGIIPVFLGLIPYLYKVLISSTAKSEWKKSISKSSFDKYISFQIRMIFIMYISVLIMTIASAFFIYVLLYNVYIIKNTKILVKIIFWIVCIVLHTYMIYYLNKIDKEKEIVVLKNGNRKKAGTILFYVPIIMNGVILLFNSCEIINFIVMICFVGCYIVAGVMLKSEPEYKYACFFFNDKSELNNILIKNINQKGDWFIINEETENQILFKQETVTMIKYSK